ncbi:hypothetical protein D3C76_230460 [compost metagenome]
MEEHLKQVRIQTNKITSELSKLSAENIDLISVINKTFKSYNINISNKDTYTSTLKQCIQIVKLRILFNSKIPKNLHNEIEELLNVFESYVIADELSEGI